jgi:signal peptidase I
MSKKSGGFLETIKTVVVAVLIALVVRTFAFEPFNIPSGSMIPTLLVGDYLFVSKYSYGYSRHTVAFGLPLFDGRVLGSPPERGDVAVFRLPRDPSQDYIKRVVGLPGDRIQIIEGVLHINGEAVEREPVDPEDVPGIADVELGQVYLETFPNGHRHYIRELSDTSRWDNTGVYTVPDGHYFMMGDNRDASQDSRVVTPGGRVEVGFVPEENLVGRADFLWFSLARGSFWEIWRWPAQLRLDRMFTGID